MNIYLKREITSVIQAGRGVTYAGNFTGKAGQDYLNRASGKLADEDYRSGTGKII
jgi:hypothetical protein